MAKKKKVKKASTKHGKAKRRTTVKADAIVLERVAKLEARVERVEAELGIGRDDLM